MQTLYLYIATWRCQADVQEDSEPVQETRRSRRSKTKPSWLITSGEFVLQQHSGTVSEPEWRNKAEFLLEVSKDSFFGWTRKQEDRWWTSISCDTNDHKASDSLMKRYQDFSVNKIYQYHILNTLAECVDMVPVLTQVLRGLMCFIYKYLWNVN